MNNTFTASPFVATAYPTPRLGFGKRRLPHSQTDGWRKNSRDGLHDDAYWVFSTLHSQRAFEYHDAGNGRTFMYRCTDAQMIGIIQGESVHIIGR